MNNGHGEFGLFPPPVNIEPHKNLVSAVSDAAQPASLALSRGALDFGGWPEKVDTHEKKMRLEPSLLISNASTKKKQIPFRYEDCSCGMMVDLVSQVLMETIAFNDGLPFVMRRPTPFHTM